jgi:mannan endo-1,4-beta-mannosidase
MKSRVLNLLAALLLIFGFSRCEVIPELQSELKQPVLVSPTNNAKNQSTNLEFSWKQSPGAEMYRMLISKSVNFETYVADTLVQGTSVSIDSLNASTSYYWKARSQTTESEGPWSDIWVFSTAAENVEPQTVALQSPDDGVEVEPENVSFDWESLSSADYHFQIATDDAFQSLVRDSVVAESGISVINLDGNQDYFWRVNPILENAPTEWSNVRSFSTAPNAATPAVTLTSPNDGSSDLATSLDLQWEALSGISNYQVQVSTASDFASTEVDEIVGDNTYTLSGLSNSQTYYWRVQADGDGTPSNWSSTYSFSTEAASGGGGGSGTTPNSDAFVTAQNSDFYVDGQVFRYAGTNAYYLPNYEKVDASVVNRALDAFESAGVNVVRMWGFYDGPAQYSNDISLQPRPGEYNEADLKRLDNVIAKGKERGIRFVIAFTNYWGELGGMPQYNEWDGNSGGGMLHFINDPDTQGWFKDYIEMLLNRVNTVTGVAYKNEPAIFSWEIMNEGRLPGGTPEELANWYQDIAQYIKSIDSNHMVSTGEEGFDEGTPSAYSRDQYSNTYALRANEGTSYIMNTEVPEIDYGTAHWYTTVFGFGSSVDSDMLRAQEAWIKDHIAIAENVNKPFVLGEWGFPGWGDNRVVEVYRDLYGIAEEVEMDGSLLWQFTADYVKCYEYGGNICWPGGRADETLYNDYVDHINAISATN